MKQQAGRGSRGQDVREALEGRNGECERVQFNRHKGYTFNRESLKARDDAKESLNVQAKQGQATVCRRGAEDGAGMRVMKGQVQVFSNPH